MRVPYLRPTNTVQSGAGYVRAMGMTRRRGIARGSLESRASAHEIHQSGRVGRSGGGNESGRAQSRGVDCVPRSGAADKEGAALRDRRASAVIFIG